MRLFFERRDGFFFKPQHADKHKKFTPDKFHDNPDRRFANERRLSSAPKNALFLPSSRLPHKYDSYTSTSRTIHKADIPENDCLKV